MKPRPGHSLESTHALAVTLAIGLLAGCSPDDGPVAKPATAAETATATTPTSNRAAASDDDQDICALLAPAEINAAFNGAIQVVVDSGSDRVCDYGIVGHEGQVLLQPMDAGTYDSRKTAYSQGNYGDVEPVAVPGLGRDAYLMGDSQIEVLVDDQQGFNLALQLFTVGELPFTREQSRAAMVELAGKVAGRL